MFCCGAPATSRLRGASGLLACGRTSARAGPRHPASMALVAPGGCVRTTRRILKPTRVVSGLMPSAALSLRELNSQAVRVPCGSGFSREESNAVHGTGYAGVRGHARSHRVLRQPKECAIPVGAGAPAKNPTRCMAPATPVFAGMPAPTGCSGSSRNAPYLWERARPRRIQRGAWHRLRRCSRACPLPQGAPAAQGMRHTCGSGRAREESNAVHGTGFRPPPCPRCARPPVHAPAAAHVRRSTLLPPGSAGTRTRSDPHPPPSAQRCARQSAAVYRSGWS